MNSFQRDHVRLRPYRFMFATGGILSSLVMTKFSWITVVIYIASALIHAYLVVIFHSLYLKFKVENENKLSQDVEA